MKNPYNVAVLIPTRGRTDALERSVKSLVDLAKNLADLELVIGFDNDDNIGFPYFQQSLQPYLDKKKVTYTILHFDSMGYAGLNRYYNRLAQEATADWLMVWNDDAIMGTKDWDSVIVKYTGQFKLLKIHVHREHPYSIFPIMPKDWFDLFGHLSRHQMTDAEVSQMAYMMDLMEIVEIHAIHDRHDLTGNNQDATYKNRELLEGNPSNPKDFHHPAFQQARLTDCDKIATYLKSKNIDMSFWENVKLGKQDPWIKMRANDINKQMNITPPPQ